MGRALRSLLLQAVPWRPWGRTGLRLHCHLPFGLQSSLRASMTNVEVSVGGDLVLVVQFGEHQPAFVPLPPGHHELVVQLRGFVTTHATVRTEVEVVAGVVKTYELVRRNRWRGTSPRNLPSAIGPRKSRCARSAVAGGPGRRA